MSTISASTTSTTAYKVTADTTGTLVLQTGATPTTALTIDSSQNITTANKFAKASMPTGSVLQVVNATYNTYTSTSSTSFTDTGLTASITPSSATSKILVFVTLNNVNLSSSSYSYDMQLAYGTGTTIKNMMNASNVPVTGIAFSIQDSPATTSATTYKVQFKVSSASATVYLNNYANTNGGTCSSITLMEIAA